MSKLKSLLANWRILIFIIAIILAVIMISPKIHTSGVLITGIEDNSTAQVNGVPSGQIILELNNQKVNAPSEYYNLVNNLENGSIVKLKTNKDTYSLVANIPENQTLPSLGITVSTVPKSNIDQGLELVGGVRVLLKPEQKLDQQQLDDIITITKKRLNVYGLKDIPVRAVNDWQGNQFISVEIAGATEKDVSLLSSQGKFEAKIGNDTVFVGGQDIKQVERSAQSGAGIRECGQGQDGGWYCQFMFPVYVSPESAKKHAEITNNLTVELVGNEQYLSKKLDLYLDDSLVESLYISANLKGQEATSFVIQGSGSGKTEYEAQTNSLEEMKRLQTVLITGSLPVKLDVAKIDVVSPVLGKEFLRSAIFAVIAAMLAVGGVVFARYRNIKIALPIVITGFSEVLIILGVASLINWNIDLAGIAGILAVLGTGVDQQIVITDELLGKRLSTDSQSDWKSRFKTALFIIIASYCTVVVAMMPLWAMGAGLLRGFAIVTIIGVTVGVFISRPAYGKIIEILLKE